MKKIVGVTYDKGLCTGVTVDGIIDDNTKPDEPVHFERIVHGHWIEEDGIQICSNCGEEHEWGDYRASYCEDCGAKMDEEVKI